LADQIDIIMAGLDEVVESTVIRLTLQLTAALVENTPVDIGWARAGWVPSIGQAYEGGRDLSPDPVKVTQALVQQQQGEAKVLGYRLADGPAWVSNNVAYINRLNEGWSKQAPAGFVQSTIAAVMAFGDYGTEQVERSSFIYRPGR
jgi:hypothetical protein